MSTERANAIADRVDHAIHVLRQIRTAARPRRAADMAAFEALAELTSSLRHHCDMGRGTPLIDIPDVTS